MNEAGAVVRVALMAKAPVAGLAKTRLAPLLGPAGAAALAARLLDHAVAQAAAARLGPVTLWTAPDATHPTFTRQRQRHGVLLAVQPGGDLGARMATVFTTAWSAAPGPVLLMGSDIPALSAAVLRQAAAALHGHDAVFVPALDGGYTLVGLAAPRAGLLQALFDGMTWSTAQVMAQTRARLAAAGMRHAELPALPDIDTPEDLVHLPPGWLAGTP